MNIDNIRRLMAEYDMLPPGTRLLCAVSGGADSVCLLHLLSGVEGIELAAAHFNHCLRGAESDRDEAFVKDLCAKMGILCYTERGDVAAFAREKGMGTEEAARELRYGFLRRIAAGEGYDRIATAHNADDNAETVLMNLARGSGLRGLCGIAPRQGEIIRPLLHSTRQEIEAYLSAHGLEHVEDSSNASDDYTRNRLRHHVAPLLREMNPAFPEAVARMTRYLLRDEEYLSSQAEAFVREKRAEGSIPVGAVLELPEAVRMRVYARMCGRSLSTVHREAIEALCRSGSPHGHADVPGMRVTRDFDRLYFGAAEAVSIAPMELKPGAREDIPGTDMTVSCEFVPECGEIHKSLNTFFFKSENICGRISLASRSEGDKVKLLGRNCTKSLKKLFSEAKLSMSQRTACPVIYDEKGVIGVYGFGTAERCAGRPGDNCIVIKIKREKGTWDNGKNT